MTAAEINQRKLEQFMTANRHRLDAAKGSADWLAMRGHWACAFDGVVQGLDRFPRFLESLRYDADRTR